MVQVHSLQREAFNGLFGTLTHWLGDANRWAVELENSDKVMSIRAINLSLVRERKGKPCRGITKCIRRSSQSQADTCKSALYSAALHYRVGRGHRLARICTELIVGK